MRRIIAANLALAALALAGGPSIVPTLTPGAAALHDHSSHHHATEAGTSYPPYIRCMGHCPY